MKAFVTGGTGFIGSQVVKQMVAQGYEVVCLVRSDHGAQRVMALGASAFRGNVLDPGTLPSPMTGCDLVIHLAGLYHLGDPDLGQFEAVNVDGTRHVLQTAVNLGIPRIVYISSIAIYGDTHGLRVSETYRMPIGQPFISAYDRSKWLADQKVVQPLVRRGAPVITVIPSAVFGPGDTSLVGQLLRYFMQGWLVLFPGPETTLSLTYIDDAVAGILLAAERGQPGERYILAGETVNLRQACREWVRITGWPAPRAYVPARLIHQLAGLARLLGGLVPGWPEILTPGAIRVLGVSYAGSAEKARRELGWSPQLLADGLQKTIDWLKTEPGIPGSAALTHQRQHAGILFLLGLMGLPIIVRIAFGKRPKLAGGGPHL